MAVPVLAMLAVLLVFGGMPGRVEPASEVSSRRFMDHLMSIDGCGRFAGIVNATANAAKTFQHRLAHGGLVVFCPDDKAVAAFQPSFDDFAADGQLAVLLYHGVARASLGERWPPTKALLVVPTLATDLAGGGYGLTVRLREDAMELLASPPSPSWGVARVTRTVTDKEVPLVVYLIDAFLLPNEPNEFHDKLLKDAQVKVILQLLIVLAIIGAVAVVIVLGICIFFYFWFILDQLITSAKYFTGKVHPTT